MIKQHQLDAMLAEQLQHFQRKIIVLDDDPTGIQTVHDVYVYTDWEYQTILEAFQAPETMFFILTNSRSFTSEKTALVHRQIAERIVTAAAETGTDYLLISRGDSTLRGHYPRETQTLAETIEKITKKPFHGEIICPFFPEGGRYTLGDIHYVEEASGLVPAGETEFAKDQTFGYQASNLCEYVAEKTAGNFKKEDCISISLDELRQMGLETVKDKLRKSHDFQKIIVNAANYTDLKLFCIAWLQVLREGGLFLARSAAALPKIIGNIPDQPLLSKDQVVNPDEKNGGLVIIGSHVNKTTRQLEALMQSDCPMEFLEFQVNACDHPGGLEAEALRIRLLAEAAIERGRTAVIYTSRRLLVQKAADKEQLLAGSVAISAALTSIVSDLSVLPGFILAKGGITSSDVGTKGLAVRKALVLGQIRKGIPVWLTGAESRIPNLPYIIFPGNVGEVTTLKEIVEELSGKEKNDA